MTPNSLLLRLGAAAAGLIAVALVVGGFGLFLIFDAALDRRTSDELNHTARLLAGQVAFAPDGALKLDQTPADPRYATPYGGLYWQVTSERGGALRSRSLWDKAIALTKAPAGETAHHETTDLEGPDGARLIAVVRAVRITNREPPELVVITVGMDRRQLASSRSAVAGLLAPSLIALGLVLALAMAAFVARALAPFRTLREDLNSMHEGRGARLPGRYADEVQPLVDDLNRLIGLQEAALTRARAQAGDMAHGLKTPLAVLSAAARRARGADPETSAVIDEQVAAMEAQVSRALARARASAVSGVERRRTPVAPVVEELVQALRRLPGAETLDWRIETAPASACPATAGDLLEMLGTVVDNARKWARTTILIATISDQGGDSIAVDDDGPGMDDAEMNEIARGRRWDETTPGTGFGLAIARDLAQATGGELLLSRSQLGGLRIVLAWRPLNLSDRTTSDRHE